MKSSLPFAFVLIFLITTSSSLADEATYTLLATGDQEVPGPGDPDGLGTGTITLNDISGLISWDFAYFDILAPSAMHIHGPGGSAGSAAGVFIPLGVATSGGAGTLIDSFVHAPLSEITDVLADPTDFYVNIHNGDFPPGAIRGQLPEPATALLFCAGALAAIRLRRR